MRSLARVRRRYRCVKRRRLRKGKPLHGCLHELVKTANMPSVIAYSFGKNGKTFI